MIDWMVKGVVFGSCNCAYGCPCQFEALPTHGNCHGFEAIRIDEGYFGEVGLDGLRSVLFYAWPGPIFEGNGAMQVLIDQEANASQRQALVRILHGEETQPAATHWKVYRSVVSTVHEPRFEPIDFEVDIDARRARLVVDSIIESRGEPIRSPATGAEHRAQIHIPGGMEFTMAEVGSATTRASGAIELALDNTYGQFNRLHHTGSGIVR